MKTKYLILFPILLTLAACQRMELEDPTLKDNTYNDGDVLTLTVEATWGSVDTKALNLDGTTLKAYWVEGEQVMVFKGDTYLGALTAHPANSSATTARLTGVITVSGLAVNDALTLLFPGRDDHNWDYTAQNGPSSAGQDGTLATLQNKFDYAMATVAIATINIDAITTKGSATFENQQSIYRFSFTLPNSVTVKDFEISSANSTLVKSRTWNTSDWASAFGAIKVTPSASSDPVYVSLRNESITDDTYNFNITGSDDALYTASKPIGSANLGQGKFLNTTITGSQPSFAPASGTITSSSEVY